MPTPIPEDISIVPGKQILGRMSNPHNGDTGVGKPRILTRRLFIIREREW